MSDTRCKRCGRTHGAATDTERLSFIESHSFVWQTKINTALSNQSPLFEMLVREGDLTLRDWLDCLVAGDAIKPIATPCVGNCYINVIPELGAFVMPRVQQ